MNREFVWLHNNSDDPGKASGFYEKLLGWAPSAGPAGMTMFARQDGPFASVSAAGDGTAGWVPYVQVDDVDAATKKATKLGAEVLKTKTRGPAGEFSIIRDPGGAAIALWQKA